MATATALAMLRADLGCLSGTLPAEITALLSQKLDAAETYLVEKGIAINESRSSDMELLVSYAAWLYRHRENGGAMPEMLRYAIHNRQIAAATKEQLW